MFCICNKDHPSITAVRANGDRHAPKKKNPDSLTRLEKLPPSSKLEQKRSINGPLVAPAMPDEPTSMYNIIQSFLFVPSTLTRDCPSLVAGDPDRLDHKGSRTQGGSYKKKTNPPSPFCRPKKGQTSQCYMYKGQCASCLVSAWRKQREIFTHRPQIISPALSPNLDPTERFIPTPVSPTYHYRPVYR